VWWVAKKSGPGKPFTNSSINGEFPPERGGPKHRWENYPTAGGNRFRQMVRGPSFKTTGVTEQLKIVRGIRKIKPPP